MPTAPCATLALTPRARPRLNALVKEVKASQAKELRWFDYAGVMFLNNVAVIVLGFMLSSAMLGVGPADGSFTASRITTTGLTVSGASGMQQEVEVMSSLSNSTVAVQSSVESTVLFAGQEAGAVPQFEWADRKSFEVPGPPPAWWWKRWLRAKFGRTATLY